MPRVNSAVKGSRGKGKQLEGDMEIRNVWFFLETGNTTCLFANRDDSVERRNIMM